MHFLINIDLFLIFIFNFFQFSQPSFLLLHYSKYYFEFTIITFFIFYNIFLKFNNFFANNQKLFL